jgi:hypothetical protein
VAALTVALLDELASLVRRARCPDCRWRALEGGTWPPAADRRRTPARRNAAGPHRQRRHRLLTGVAFRMATPQVHLIDHPLVQHKLTLMRQKDRSTNSFRTLMSEISMLMAYEVTREMPMQTIEIETPLERMKSRVIDGKKTVFVVIMRAGAGFLDGMLNVVPGARVGHIGLYRDP